MNQLSVSNDPPHSASGLYVWRKNSNVDLCYSSCGNISTDIRPSRPETRGVLTDKPGASRKFPPKNNTLKVTRHWQSSIFVLVLSTNNGK